MGCVPRLPFSPARCGFKAAVPSQISCWGFRRPGQGVGGAQEQGWGGCQAGLAWMNAGPEQGQWWGRDVAPTRLGRLDFLGNQKSEGGQKVHLLTDADCWRTRRLPPRSLRQRAAPQPDEPSRGQRSSGPGRMPPSFSLDQLALLTLFLILSPGSPERSTTHIVYTSLDLFGLSFPICKMETIIVSTFLSCFEGSMTAHEGRTTTVPGTRPAPSKQQFSFYCRR